MHPHTVEKPVLPICVCLFALAWFLCRFPPSPTSHSLSTSILEHRGGWAAGRARSHNRTATEAEPGQEEERKKEKTRKAKKVRKKRKEWDDQQPA